VTLRGRTVLFWTLTLALPFLALAALEVVLRVAGLFAPEPLVIRTERMGRTVLQFNARLPHRYFDERRVSVPALSPDHFDVEKTPSHVRIVCLGESTTQGFPFDGHVTFPKQLEHLLRLRFPDRRIEVLNAGVSAVNSYSVLDILPEILDIKPDFVLVYLGHNEFYGAFGGASTVSFGRQDLLVRTYLRLLRLHTVQCVRATLSAVGGMFRGPASSRTLMAEVVRETRIPVNSPLRDHALDVFRRNLEEIQERCRERGVPVLFGTLVSNVADMPPFAADGDASLFFGGREALAALDTARAKRLLVEAKDRDLIPFRAPEAFNRVIRDIAMRDGAAVVDVAAAFADASPGGIPGNALLCDHLHPNPDGYYLMARKYYEAVLAAGNLAGGDSSFRPGRAPFAVGDLDWDIGLMKIFEMTHRWPFPESQVTVRDYVPRRDPTAGRIAFRYLFEENVWSRAQYAMADEYIKRGDPEGARDRYRAVALFAADDPYPMAQIAGTWEKSGNWAKAEEALAEAVQRARGKGLLLYRLAQTQYRQGRADQAAASLGEAAAAPELTREQRFNALFYRAGFLVEAGDTVRARQSLHSILVEDPEFRPALRFLAQIGDK
jgi:lysophospholipase L1-like esterase/Tfp pilus assembly protein PilF